MLKYVFSVFLVISSSISLTYAKPVDYGVECKKYASSRAWPYMHKFVASHFLPELENCADKKILDAGCGVGLWSIYASSHGANVFGIDIQPEMIRQAQEEAIKTGVAHKTTFQVGNIASLPYENDFFDFSLSINVACNLDYESFNLHFSELSRVLKKNGRAIIIAPISLEKVFIKDNRDMQIVMHNIHDALDNLSPNPSGPLIIQVLNQLEDILSATFAVKNNKLVLITHVNELEEGQEIWRKLPNITIPNIYYSEESYEKALKEAHFKVEKVLHPRFKSEAERIAYNASIPEDCRMGQEYVRSSPFIIFRVKKI